MLNNDKPVKQRTESQNKALHLYFTQLAELLNDSGLDMKKTLKPGIDIPWSSKSIKEFLFRPIMKSQLQKDSTTELTTKEIDQVVDVINRHLGEKFGITLGFPGLDSLLFKKEYAQKDK